MVNIHHIRLSRIRRMVEGRHTIREHQARTLFTLRHQVEVHSLHLGNSRSHGPLPLEVIRRHPRLLQVDTVHAMENTCLVEVVKCIPRNLHGISAPFDTKCTAWLEQELKILAIDRLATKSHGAASNLRIPEVSDRTSGLLSAVQGLHLGISQSPQ